MKTVLHVEDFRDGEKQRDNGPLAWARLVGRDRGGRFITCVAFAETATRLAGDLDRITPEGMLLSQLNLAVEIEGKLEEKPRVRGDTPVLRASGQPVVDRTLKISRYAILSGPTLELAHLGRQAAAAEAEAARLLGLAEGATFDEIRDAAGAAGPAAGALLAALDFVHRASAAAEPAAPEEASEPEADAAPAVEAAPAAADAAPEAAPAQAAAASPAASAAAAPSSISM
jgi:hypothetical protein